MPIAILLILLLLFGCSSSALVEDSNPVKMYSRGNYHVSKYVREGFPEKIYASDLDPSGAAASIALILQILKKESLDERDVLREIYKHGDADRMVARGGGVSFYDIKRVLDVHGLRMSGVETRIYAPFSDPPKLLRRMSIVGNQGMRGRFPFIALFDKGEEGGREYVVVIQEDGRNILIVDPTQGRVLISEKDFLDHVSVVGFVSSQ